MNKLRLFKATFIMLLIMGVSANSFAQKEEKKAKTEKNIKRPGIVGHAATDKFVDSSFDVYERNIKLTDKLSNAAGNVGEVKEIKNELESQTKEVKGLLGQSAHVMKEAKTITPKTNSMKAVKAINAATKALNTTKENFPIQLEQIKNQESN
ncbi:MAG: hypothetical protein H6587_09910 [Flavobacteriales bacterium]|nr:hypothetical protein [Flavobacteriales bacterium]